jgi:hypothetical protein
MNSRQAVHFRKRSGWKRWLLRAVVTAIVLPTVVVLGTRTYNRWQGSERLAEVHAKLDETDPGWRLDDLLAERYARFAPDEQNPMSLMRRVHPRQPDAFKTWSLREPRWLADRDSNQLPDPDEAVVAELVRAECLDVIEPLRLLRYMTSPGGYRLDVKPNVWATLLGPTTEVRGVVALLQLDALLHALEGEPDRAVLSTHAALNAGRGIGEEPFLISMLVRMATDMIVVQTIERVLGWAHPRAGLPELQAALLAEADEPLLTIGLRGERAMNDRLLENLDTGKVSLKAFSDSIKSAFSPVADIGWWFYRGYLPGDRAALLETLTAYLSASRQPSPEQAALFAAVPVPPKDRAHLLSWLLLPAVDKVAAADWRRKARLRSAAVGLACERFRRANNRWPNDLAEIPSTILPSIPLDPFDGQPLRYRRAVDGVVIYSVGPDRTDDSGNLTTKPAKPGEDHGFRLWDPEHRRAEPLSTVEVPE